MSIAALHPVPLAAPSAVPVATVPVGAPADPGIAMEAGQSRSLDGPKLGYGVRSGRVEIYAALLRDGAPASGRHFVCEVAAGGLIPPLLATVDGLALSVVAIEAAVLAPLPHHVMLDIVAVSERAAALATQLDQWIAALGGALVPLVGTSPSGMTAETVGSSVALAAGAAMSVRGGIGWCSTVDAELLTATGTAAPRIDAQQHAVLAPGLWLTAETPGTVTSVATPAGLAQPFWPDVLAAFHAQALAALANHLAARDTTLRDLANARGERIARSLERTIGRFAGVLDHAPAWTGAAASDERLLGPFVMVCEAVGIDLTQRVREQIRRVATVEDAARHARVRQRQIALRGEWWREDFGAFIGFLDDDRKPVAVLPAGSGRWKIVDPDGGRDLAVNAEVAARLQPQAYMLYRGLAAKPIVLKDVLLLGWKENRRDFYVALLTSFAIGLLGLATPLATRLAFDRFIPSHEQLQLIELSVGLIMAAVISAGFRLTYDMAFLRLDGRMAAQTQAAMVDRVLRLPPAALRFASADLAQRAMAVDSVRRSTVGFVLGSLAALFSWVVNVAMMAWYAPLATVVASLCFLVLLALSYLAATRQLDAIRRGQEILSDVTTLIFHLIRGIGVLRTSGAEARAFARWGQDFAEMRARSYRSQRISSLLETFFAGFDVITMAAVFVILAELPAKDFSTGAFMSFIASYGVFIACSIQIARGISGVINAKPAWERALPLLRNVPEGGAAKRDPGTLTGAIEMTNVAFRYAADTPMVLQGLSLAVAAGEFVALVGASGSGKSTTVRLLLGNVAPLAGAIQYDSMDLQHLDIPLVRRQIGVVLQNGKLMPGSIFENIMGAHHGTLDDAWEAARQAGIEPEIRSLPMGMHTILTEATAAFSGGQIQRFMIARALVGKPRILVLDEATSALDNVTQAIVTTALSRLAVTRIVVAHRLSTVKSADRICVFDGGRIVQSGTYDQLVAAKGPFAELARRQLV
jgi:NHLM bacteriocin system ABC transporter ATP-binding protein